jgi:hypothetical protein
MSATNAQIDTTEYYTADELETVISLYEPSENSDIDKMNDIEKKIGKFY